MAAGKYATKGQTDDTRAILNRTMQPERKEADEISFIILHPGVAAHMRTIGLGLEAAAKLADHAGKHALARSLRAEAAKMNSPYHPAQLILHALHVGGGASAKSAGSSDKKK